MESVYKEFALSFKEANKIDVNADSLDDLILINNSYLHPYLMFVKEHQAFFRAIRLHPARFKTEDAFGGIYTRVLEPIMARFGIDKKKASYIVEYYIKGLNAVIFRWADGGCKDDIDYMVKVIEGCIKPYFKENEK